MKRCAENAFMKKCLISLSLFLLANLHVFSQERALFTWEHYPSYRNIEHIAGDENVLFAASSFGLYSYRNGQEPNVISQKEGLSDVAISTMRFLPETNELLVGHRSGSIDLVTQRGITSELSLSRLDSRLSKTLYDVTIIDQSAYFASDLGIVEYLIPERKIRDIFRNIGPGANEVSAFAIVNLLDTLFAFTDQGLFKGVISKNLLDFTQWEQLSSESYTESTDAVIEGQKIFISQGTETLNVLDLSANTTEFFPFEEPISGLYASESDVLITSKNELWSIKDGPPTLELSANAKLTSAFRQQQVLWLGLENEGLQNSIDQNILLPQGPNYDFPTHLSSIADDMLLFFGEESYDTYQEGSWVSQSGNESEWVDAVEFNDETYLLTANGILSDPDDETSINFPAGNGIPNNLFVFDNKLWVTISNATAPLICSSDLVNWQVFASTTFGTSTLVNPQISIGGVLYFEDERNRLIAYDPLSEQIRRLDRNDGISGTLNDYMIDQEDALFIATSEGLMYYPDATFIFNTDEISEAFIGVGGLIQSDHFTNLAIDTGNRKWISTTDGLWLYDASISDEINRFTVQNSALPANDILSITFQPTNGLLWLSTAKGLATYQTDALAGQFFHQNVKIFPNPVSISQDPRQLGLSGLYQNAEIKITSLSGVYIREVQSNGSLASWDLTDSYGRLVSPGIYLFFSSGPDGDETYVGKALITP